MMRKILTWFNKNEYKSGIQINVSKNEETKFILKVDKIRMGILYCKDGDWYFKYCKEFKDRSDEYNRITGFPDLDKTYKSKTLWPFFQTRIPGLKQPSVQEIIKEEKIDQTNEAALLKRFGKKTITNPYELEMA
jgi:HipA-like protein